MTKTDKTPEDLVAKKRSSSFSMKLQDMPHGSSILGTTVHDHKLFVITEESIHCIELADSVDPARTNAKITNTQQKILSRGASSPVIYKTFLMAEVLTKPKVLAEDKIDSIIASALEAAKNLSAAQDQLDSLISSEKEAMPENPATSDESSTRIPSFMSVEAFANTFILRCDAVLRSLFDIVKILYPEWNAKLYFEGFRDYLLLREKDEVFAKYLSEHMQFIKAIREARNCVEHPKEHKKVLIRNFYQHSSGAISVPTIEIIHLMYNQPEIGLSTYISSTIADLSEMFEGIMALSFDRRGGKFGAVKFRVYEAPEDRRRYGTVRYDITIENLSTIGR